MKTFSVRGPQSSPSALTNATPHPQSSRQASGLATATVPEALPELLPLPDPAQHSLPSCLLVDFNRQFSQVPLSSSAPGTFFRTILTLLDTLWPWIPLHRNVCLFYVVLCVDSRCVSENVWRGAVHRGSAWWMNVFKYAWHEPQTWLVWTYTSFGLSFIYSHSPDTFCRDLLKQNGPIVGLLSRSSCALSGLDSSWCLIIFYIGTNLIFWVPKWIIVI